MNLLIITPYIPYPLSEGGKISQYAMIDYLRSIHSITLAVVSETAEDRTSISTLKNLWPDVKIEIIDVVKEQIPKNVLKTFLRPYFYKVKDVLKSKGVPQKSNSDFDNEHLLHLPYLKNKEFIYYIDNIVKSQQFDIIQVDIIDFADIIYMVPKSSTTVFVHHELKFARLKSAMSGENILYENYVHDFVKSHEIQILQKFSAVIVFSDIDKSKLENNVELYGKVFSSPFPILESHFTKHVTPSDSIEKLVFVGGDGHFPNKHAVEWYINEVYPLIKNTINLKLHVIGKWGVDNITALSEKCENNIVFTGFVDDITTYCKNSIMLVPIHIGSGIRTKILYAMAQGLPIISTSIGCEGIRIKDKENILLANTGQEFCDCIEVVCNDYNLRLKISSEAQKVARNTYSQKAAGELRSNILKQIASSN